MGMSGKFHGDRPAGFKSASWYGKGDQVDEEGNEIGGVCVSCRQYDVELKNGFCRDAACKRKRQSLAVVEGRAIKLVDGLPNGQKVLHSKNGKQIIK